MKKNLIALLLSSLLGAATVLPALASGSYSGSPPKPPAKLGDGMKLDNEKYGLGQKIYDGKADLMAHGNADAQMEKLKMIQAQLPKEAAMKKDLVAFAGKLSAAELDALDYFVSHRFAMKK